MAQFGPMCKQRSVGGIWGGVSTSYQAPEESLPVPLPVLPGLYFCNRVQPGGPQTGICNGVQNSRCPGNIKIWDVLTPTSLNWGMGHMEQGH